MYPFVHVRTCACRACKAERRQRRFEAGDRRFWEAGLKRDGTFVLKEPEAGVVELDHD